MDLNPEATGKGERRSHPSGYQYDLGNPQVAATSAGGLGQPHLNGTIKPDFSQVETDAGQLAFDPRQACSFRRSGRSFWRKRAVQVPPKPDLHASHRPAGRGGQAHRNQLRHRHRAALRGGPEVRVGDGRGQSPFTILRAQRSRVEARASAWRTPIGSKAGLQPRRGGRQPVVFKEIYGLTCSSRAAARASGE